MTNPFDPPPAAHPVANQNHPLWKVILAWVTIVFGTLIIMGGIFAGGFLGALLIGLAFIAPGAVYLFLPRGQRRWKFVIPGMIIALIAGGALTPATPDPSTDPAPTTVTTTSSATSSASSTRTTTSSESSSSTTTSEKTSSETSPSAEEPAVDEPTPAPEDQQHGFIAPAPAPAPEPAPAPAPAPVVEQPAPAPVVEQPAPAPAPAPSPSTGGGLTCAQIGHKTYIGDGIYVPDHDKDGDGVGCESY